MSRHRANGSMLALVRSGPLDDGITHFIELAPPFDGVEARYALCLHQALPIESLDLECFILGCHQGEYGLPQISQSRTQRVLWHPYIAWTNNESRGGVGLPQKSIVKLLVLTTSHL